MKKYTVTLTLESGMLIGSGNDTFELGGVDATTIVDGTGKPYIPGSSFKGKLRYLAIESNVDEMFINNCFGKKTVEGEKQVFDLSKRFLFSDLRLVDSVEDETKKDAPNFFEIKSENTINDKKEATPRTNKRTIAGLTFQGSIMVPLGDKSVSDVAQLKQLIENKLCNYYIGGQGSRGYGWIKTATFEEAKGGEQ